VDRHVVDKTDIAGNSRYLFQWAGDNSVNSPLPSPPTALRECAGLELKSDTAAVSVLAVDHVERPLPN
ncbi:MAG TPA: DUF3738 domain-containing protein, partial [Candidatus Acidoferrum sp.]|nr:DUF3738 domain-containing protein [Candidatus Acidoferrum sp.]